MWALIDCNSFFCSVEKVFHPGLEGKPVCVLSNNDGCIVALTPEAKAIGLHRGDPIFKVKDIVDRYKVEVFSTNMYLYAAMSKRVNSIMRKAVMHVEQYSIDESFLNLKGYERTYNLEEFMRELAERIRLYTDIPVSVGVAPSKTLAKMGSKFAKKYKGYRGVCMIDTDEKRRKALELFDLSDVWGIGNRTFEKLHYLGIDSPLQFADKSESWVRANFHKPGHQTWLELNGIPCIDTSEIIQNKNICTSRSFGEMVSDLPSLKASIATFAGSCANKLRGQNAGAQAVTVFLMSNRFREDLEQYGNSASTTFVVPTSDTLEITNAALRILEHIYRPGILYKKSGVIVSNIVSMNQIQGDLFDSIPNRPQRQQLMKTIDALNHRYGLKTIQLGVEGESKQPWKVKCEHRSPNYLTDLNEILTVRC
ncbi:MAG: Y-family DNA polymerase [Bacteroidaceae bacterium]|nr:Y-family DNA polymerase [Bacteroidaceae bacterium]